MAERLVPSQWTGSLHLDLRNARGWSAGALDLAVGRDTVQVRHQGRELAILDRDQFRDWMIRPQFAYVADDTAWATEMDVTVFQVGRSRFTITPESMAHLLTVV